MSLRLGLALDHRNVAQFETVLSARGVDLRRYLARAAGSDWFILVRPEQLQAEWALGGTRVVGLDDIGAPPEAADTSLRSWALGLQQELARLPRGQQGHRGATKFGFWHANGCSCGDLARLIEKKTIDAIGDGHERIYEPYCRKPECLRDLAEFVNADALRVAKLPIDPEALDLIRDAEFEGGWLARSDGGPYDDFWINLMRAVRPEYGCGGVLAGRALWQEFVEDGRIDRIEQDLGDRLSAVATLFDGERHTEASKRIQNAFRHLSAGDAFDPMSWAHYERLLPVLTPPQASILDGFFHGTTAMLAAFAKTHGDPYEVAVQTAQAAWLLNRAVWRQTAKSEAINDHPPLVATTPDKTAAANLSWLYLTLAATLPDLRVKPERLPDMTEAVLAIGADTDGPLAAWLTRRLRLHPHGIRDRTGMSDDEIIAAVLENETRANIARVGLPGEWAVDNFDVFYAVDPDDGGIVFISNKGRKHSRAFRGQPAASVTIRTGHPHGSGEQVESVTIHGPVEALPEAEWDHAYKLLIHKNPNEPTPLQDMKSGSSPMQLYKLLPDEQEPIKLWSEAPGRVAKDPKALLSPQGPVAALRAREERRRGGPPLDPGIVSAAVELGMVI